MRLEELSKKIKKMDYELEVSFAKFKPRNYIPSTSSNFYVEILSFGPKVKDLEKKLIFLGSKKEKRLLVKNVEVEEGNIEMSSVSLLDFYKIEYPKGWKKPETISITFFDDHNGNIYNFFQSYVKKCNLNKFRGIKPINLEQYSMEIQLTRYNKVGKTIMESTYTIFPKAIPKWVDDYENSSMQIFNIEFTILDFKIDFKGDKIGKE